MKKITLMMGLLVALSGASAFASDFSASADRGIAPQEELNTAIRPPFWRRGPIFRRGPHWDRGRHWGWDHRRGWGRGRGWGRH